MKILKYEPYVIGGVPYQELEIEYDESDNGTCIQLDDIHEWIEEERKTAKKSQKKLLDKLEVALEWN